MQLNEENYFSTEANLAYWSVSQFKEFNKCEACGLAQVYGKYQREESDALLIGSYVDAAFSGTMNDFISKHEDQMISKRGNKLLAKFEHADTIINRVAKDPLMMEYLKGDKQVIMSDVIEGLSWKIKMDFYTGDRIVDLKVVKDFNDIYDPGYGWRSWIEYWGYDIQGAIYQRIEQNVTGRKTPLPFYLAAVTKEKVPDIKVIQIPQHILDAAYSLVSSKIERFDMIKYGEVEPIRCEKCDYCKMTKVLTEPEIYEIKEAV